MAASEADYMRGDGLGEGGRTVVAEMPVILPPAPAKKQQQPPQQTIDEFWDKFTTKAPGKATTVIPHNEYVEKRAKQAAKAVNQTTTSSYEDAAALCSAKVAKIVKECRRVNQKYRDPHFDLESDLKWGRRDTLESLSNRKPPESPNPDEDGGDAAQSSFRPKSVKRVVDIFDAPKFYVDGPSANDVRQGRDGDCWLLAALCTLSNKPSLIERLCVARDEQVGVYGFVFYRDGEWISEIIDDKLFLTKPDFDESFLERLLWEDRERVNSEEQYREAYQSGSGALYFAQCENQHETWLPLLEKAYAKAHGDYAAIEGGFTGEGIEDLTGGVTSELYTGDILDKEYFWKEELMKVNDQFLFGCSTGMWGVGWGDRKGIVELHAYSVMRAVEMDGKRLVLLKNPWGKGEWKGAWSDGSKEWTAEWLTKLGHSFGDDGAFWISYEDLLRKYQAFDRTRLFGPEWKVTSVWTTLDIPWTVDYLDTSFAITVTKTGPVVIVLSQLDDRYYRGLEGQYNFELNFRLHQAGQQDYVVRSISPYCQTRSVNVELELEAGEYTVLMKINATRNTEKLPVEEVVRNYARERRDKLVAVGMSYDLAHSKGKVVETPEEKKARKAAEKRKKEKEKAKLKKEVMKQRERNHYIAEKERKKRLERRQKRKAKDDAKKAAKAEKRRAKKEERQKAKAEAAAKKAAEAEASKDEAASKAKEESAAEPDTKEEKHVEILTPGATPGATPGPEDAEAKKDLVPGDSESSNTDASIKTPSDSEKSQSGETPEDKVEKPLSEAKPTDLEAEEPSEKPKVAADDVEAVKEEEEARTSAANEENTSDEKQPDEAERTESEPECESEEDDDDDDDISETSISDISEISDAALEEELEDRANAPVLPPLPPPGPGMFYDEPDEFEANPWNAVATVGLRVYYKVSEADKAEEIVKLRVVRPDPYSEDKDDDADEEADDEADKDGEAKENSEGKDAEGKTKPEEEKSSKGLDVDDSSKDATLVGDGEAKKHSIVPTEG